MVGEKSRPKTAVSIAERTATAGAIDWFYRESRPEAATDKLPVVFLHGIPSHSFCWADLLPMVAAQAGRLAIAPDWPGFGSSGKPSSRDFAYTPQAYLDALQAFFDAIGIERGSLVVQGFLGSVGIQYAQRHPDRIERLIVLNTPLAPDARLPWTMRQWGWPLVGEMLTQDPLLVDRALESGSGYEIDAQNLSVYRQPFLKNSQAGRSLLAATKNLQLARATAEIDAGWAKWTSQTLILWGAGDPWLDIEAARQLAAAPHVELVELPQAKHYPQEHWAEEIGSSLVNFLRRQAI